MDNLKAVIKTAENHGLIFSGIQSGLIHFNCPDKKSTLAIEEIDCSVNSLVSMIYRWEQNWFNKTTEIKGF